MPNDFLEQLNSLVQSHNSNGMCISVVCNQVEVSFGGQSEELHIQGIC